MFFRKARSRPAPRPTGPSARYLPLVTSLLAQHQIRVKRWRKTSSGCAWLIRHRDGSLVRLLESPAPRGPVSLAIFLHEVGHHAIGFGRYRLRCHEEYKAWEWALGTMRDHGFPVTGSVQRRVDRSLRHAVAKSLRRGLRRLPAELVPYLPPSVKPAAIPTGA